MDAGMARAIWPRIYADERGYYNYKYNSWNADYRRWLQIRADLSRRPPKLLLAEREER